MNLEKIQELWEEDSKINEFNLDTESVKIPQLHQKYMILYNQFNLMLKEAQMKQRKLYKEKYEYYSGKAPKEVYKDNPFDHKVMKQDLPMYIEADEDFQKGSLKISYLETLINYIESILKQLTNRTYQIKNAIEHRRFESGA